MKKSIFLLFMLLGSLLMKARADIPYTELNYNVHYHWGMIDVAIGHGVATIEKTGDSFVGTLDGNSIPWNGRVFCISDTLRANLTPTVEKIDYINGWYMKPKTSLYRSSSFNPNDPAFYKNIKGEGELDASSDTMEAVTVMADMLSLFYYFREIDFPGMTEGGIVTIPIQSAGGSEEVRVTYKGKSTLNLDGTDWHTYRVAFEFSYRGVMSGYTVDAEVSADSRIPLIMSSSLPIGHVEMKYHE